jgi:hypothetical protein
MITINECRVSADNKRIYVDIEAAVGFKITSANLWTESTFKVYSRKKVIPLSKLTNKELFFIDASSIGLIRFDGIYFLEFETDETPVGSTQFLNPVTAVVTNLVGYYKCAMEMLLRTSGSYLNIFSSGVTDSGDANNVMAVHLLLDAISEAIKLNRYIDAITLLGRLKTICSSCVDCANVPDEAGCEDCGSSSHF